MKTNKQTNKFLTGNTCVHWGGSPIASGTDSLCCLSTSCVCWSHANQQDLEEEPQEQRRIHCRQHHPSWLYERYLLFEDLKFIQVVALPQIT